jgi:hypothetical protein
MVTVHYTLVVVMEAPVVVVESLVIHEETQELELLAKETTAVQVQDLEQILVLAEEVLEHKVATVTLRMAQLDLEKAELDYCGLMVLGMLVVVAPLVILDKAVTAVLVAAAAEVLAQMALTVYKVIAQEQSTLVVAVVVYTAQDLPNKVDQVSLLSAMRFKEILWHIMQK